MTIGYGTRKESVSYTHLDVYKRQSKTSAEPDKSITGRKNGIIPYVMKDQALTLGTRSFSLLEALDKSRLSLTENELKNLQHFQTSHVLEPAALFAGDAKCVWIDHYSELVLSVVQYRDNNSLEGSINLSLIHI